MIWAKRILAEHDAFKAEVQAFQSGVTGVLRLGLVPSASTIRMEPQVETDSIASVWVAQSRYWYCCSPAVAAAGALGLLLGIGHAYWAMTAAAVSLAGSDLFSRVQRGIHRVLGTCAGLGVTAGLLLLHPGTTVLVFLVIVLQFTTELFMVRHDGLALTFSRP